MADTTITGIQELQQANTKLIASLQPSGALGRAIQYAVIQADRYAVSITHVVSGALRASLRMEVDGLHGSIYIDPSTVNPSGQKPFVYGAIEEARGGSHAFFQRTLNEAGDMIAKAAIAGFVKELP